MREFRQGNIRFTDMIAGRNNNTYFNGRKIPNHFKGGCNICIVGHYHDLIDDTICGIVIRMKRKINVSLFFFNLPD